MPPLRARRLAESRRRRSWRSWMSCTWTGFADGTRQTVRAVSADRQDRVNAQSSIGAEAVLDGHDRPASRSEIGARRHRVRDARVARRTSRGGKARAGRSAPSAYATDRERRSRRSDRGDRRMVDGSGAAESSPQRGVVDAAVSIMGWQIENSADQIGSTRSQTASIADNAPAWSEHLRPQRSISAYGPASSGLRSVPTPERYRPLTIALSRRHAREVDRQARARNPARRPPRTPRIGERDERPGASCSATEHRVCVFHAHAPLSPCQTLHQQ